MAYPWRAVKPTTHPLAWVPPLQRLANLCFAAALAFLMATSAIAQDDTASEGLSGGSAQTGSGSSDDSNRANPAPPPANPRPPNVDAWGNLVLTGKPLTFVGGFSVIRDDNLFKLATPSSDTIQTMSLGLRVNKSYSLQTFQFNFNKTFTRYSNFSYLNNSGMDYRGAWLWSLTPRITGTLSRDYRQSLVPFQETNGSTSRNMRVSENTNFNLDAWVTGGWHLTGGLNRSEQRTSQSVTVSPDTFTLSRELGGRYLTLSGNSISFVQRNTSGGYINSAGTITSLTANGFRREESELRISWRATAKSSFSGRLTWLQHRQLGASQYDVAGPAVDITYLWAVTGALQVSISARDSITPTPDVVYTKITNKGLTIAPTWQFSPKTTIQASLSTTRNEYGGSSGTAPLTGPARIDTVDSASLGVNWAALPTLTLGASLQRQQRRSNTAPLTDFNDTTANFNASVAF